MSKKSAKASSSEKDFWLLKEWITEFGAQYGITTVRHLQRCCAGEEVTRDYGAEVYKYKLPEEWVAEKLPTGAHGTWILRRRK